MAEQVRLADVQDPPGAAAEQIDAGRARQPGGQSQLLLRARATSLGWAAGSRAEAAGQEIVVTVTPGSEPVVAASDLRDGQHLAALGADARGKAEVEAAALGRCRLFCDEWEQAAGGGELSGAVDRGLTRAEVTQLGDVLIGRAPGRTSREEVTLFDSTGLATQDLGIAIAVHQRWRAGEVSAVEVPL